MDESCTVVNEVTPTRNTLEMVTLYVAHIVNLIWDL